MQSSREPHERRQHAMRVAGVLTLALFLVWAATLSLRFALPSSSSEAEVANSGDQASLSASAAAAEAAQSAHLEVSTTSVLNN